MIEEKRHDAVRLDHHLRVEQVDRLRGVRVVENADAPEEIEHLLLHAPLGTPVGPPPLPVPSLHADLLAQAHSPSERLRPCASLTLLSASRDGTCAELGLRPAV